MNKDNMVKMYYVNTQWNVMCAISTEKEYAYSFANIFGLKKPKKVYLTKEEAVEFEKKYHDKILEYYCGYYDRIDETPFPICVHDAVDELLINEFAFEGMESLTNLKHMIPLIEPELLDSSKVTKLNNICDGFTEYVYKEVLSYCNDPGCYDLHELFELSINYRMIFNILTKRYLAMLNDPYREEGDNDLFNYK